jgi:tRNA (guanine-N7-)-methyltransferase
MPRRRLYRHRTCPPDTRALALYLRRWPGERLYRDPDTFPRITSTCLFGNDRPLELEIGCGSADFLCDLARRNPERNFVGLDISTKSLHQAVATAAKVALDNILFLKADFRLVYPLLVPGSLRAAYLHFPDPATRTRYRHRRIFSGKFLDAMSCSLVPGGRLSVMTDHEPYFMELLTLAERDDRWRKTHEERYLTGFETEAKSKFQHLWESQGLPTLRFELAKRASVSET